MALGVPILVLIRDPPTPGGNIIRGVAKPPCLAGEEHKQRGKRRGVQGLKDGGDEAGQQSKSGGVQI